MSANLGDARRALHRGETGEALVHLWNAYEFARGESDPQAYAQIEDLARKAAKQGDEGERADAGRLLEALGAAPAEPAEGEPYADVEPTWVPTGSEAPRTPSGGPGPTPAEKAEPEPEEPAAPRRGGIPVGLLILIASVLFLFLRDQFR
jgi:hypothetical protein